MVFDPKNNPEDLKILNEIVENMARKFHSKVKLAPGVGSIEIDGKKYEFFGFGEWVTIWAHWYERKMKEIYAKVDGYTVTERWNAVAKLILQHMKDPLADQNAKTILHDIFALMEKPDKDPAEPESIQPDLDKIYNTLNKQVLSKLVKGDKLDDSMVPMVWDLLKKHVLTEELSALTFLENYHEWSTVAYDSGQKLHAESPQKS